MVQTAKAGVLQENDALPGTNSKYSNRLAKWINTYLLYGMSERGAFKSSMLYI